MLPRRRRRVLRPLVALGLVALLAGLGANGAARAQTPDTGLADQFGGYKLSSRGNGILLAFDAVGFVPNNPRVLQQGLPEAQATGAAGTNYALSSLDYPGSVVGDLGAIVAQGGGGDAGAAVPSYPVQARAYFPSGPTEVRQELGGAGMVSLTTATTSDGTATYSGNDLPQFLQSTGVSVHANTHLEDGRAVSQLRAEMTNVDFAGVLHIGSLVTDIRGDTDGTKGVSSGETTVSGVTVLGLPATIDAAGVHLTDPSGGGGSSTTTSTTKKPSVLDPILGPVTSQVPLTGLSDALKPVAQGLSALITTVVGSTGSVNDLLAQAGIKVRLLAPVANDAGPVADRVADGLSIEMTYNPNTNATLSQLFSLLPTSQLPSDPLIPGLPVNSSPQGLVSLLQQVYGMTISLVPGAVSSQASPPFASPSFSGGGAGGTSGSTGSTGSGSTGKSGFSTPAPSLGGGGGGSGAGGTIADAAPISFFGDAIPVWAAVLLLLSAPLWGAASSKLADNTLAAVSSSCPEGLDAPDPPGGAT